METNFDVIDELSKVFSSALNKLLREIDLNNEKLYKTDDVTKLMTDWNEIIEKYDGDIDGMDN